MCLGCVVAAGCAAGAGHDSAAAASTQTGAVPAVSTGQASADQAGQASQVVDGAAPGSSAGAAGDVSAASVPELAGAGAAGAGAAVAGAAAPDQLPPMAADAGSGASSQPTAAVTTSPTGCPLPPVGASVEEIDALNFVNTLRRAAGASCVTLDLAISQAASAHCAYYSLNKEIDPLCTQSPHYEVEGCLGFTGATPADRVRAAGSTSNAGGEVMAFLNDPLHAIQIWVDSVWHRIPILDPATTVIGYGSAEGCDTIDFGSGKVDAKNVVLYPYDGQLDVNPAFDGSNEGPMPPAPATGWPSSNPISIYAQRLNVTEHLLFVDGDPTPLEHTWLDPMAPSLAADQQRLLRNVVFMYANQPFLPNTRYRVKISGTYAGGTLSREWTFTTGKGPQRRMRP